MQTGELLLMADLLASAETEVLKLRAELVKVREHICRHRLQATYFKSQVWDGEVVEDLPHDLELWSALEDTP